MNAKKLIKNSKPTKITPAPAAESAVNGASKKKIVVSYKNLQPEISEMLKEKYPKGYSDNLIKVDKGNGSFFYAITLDTDGVDYLIKVDVKIDSEPEEVEKALFGGGDRDGGEEDDFPEGDESFEQTTEEDE